MTQSLWIRVMVTLTALVVTSVAGPQQPDRQSTPGCNSTAHALYWKIRSVIDALLPNNGKIIQNYKPGKSIKMTGGNPPPNINVNLVQQTMHLVFMQDDTSKLSLITGDGKNFKLTVQLSTHKGIMQSRFKGSESKSNTTLEFICTTYYKSRRYIVVVLFKVSSANAAAVVKEVKIHYRNDFDYNLIKYTGQPGLQEKCLFVTYIEDACKTAEGEHENIQNRLMETYINKTMENVKFTSCA